VRTSAGERPDDEVVRIAGERIAPDGVPAANRAFDVTPARLVTAFVTERGVLRPLYTDALRALPRRKRRTPPVRFRGDDASPDRRPRAGACDGDQKEAV
jgi:initiation factor 2B subunit 1/2 family protein